MGFLDLFKSSSASGGQVRYLEASFQELSPFQRELRDEDRKDGFSPIDSATKRNRTWEDVEKNLKDAFDAWSVNPLAKSYCDYVRFFVIGKGTLIDVPDSEGDDARRRVKDFIKLNEWELMEKQICSELSRDGEVFVRFHGKNIFNREADIQAVTLIDPLEVPSIDCRELGNPLRYRRAFKKLGEMADDGTQETKDDAYWIPGDEIIHIKVNTSHNELRGRSDLLPALPWLALLKNWLTDLARRNYMIGAYVWDVECKAGVKPQAVAANYPNAPMPGTAIFHGPNEIWKVITPDLHWADSSVGARTLKLIVMSAFKHPETWYGDTGSSNLATAKALNMHTLKAFIDRQDLLAWYFERIIEKGAGVENVIVKFPELVSEEARHKALALKALSEALANLETSDLLSKEASYRILQQFVDGLDNWADDESGASEKEKIEKEKGDEEEEPESPPEENPFTPLAKELPEGYNGNDETE